MAHTDIFEGIDPLELEEELPEPKWRKPLLFIISIFLILLMVTFILPDNIQSFVASKTVKDSKLSFPDANVTFQNNALQLLQEEFITNEHDRGMSADQIKNEVIPDLLFYGLHLANRFDVKLHEQYLKRIEHNKERFQDIKERKNS